MEVIKSRQNQAIKFAKKLQDVKQRTTESMFIMEGIRVLQEAVKTGRPIHSLYYSDGITDEAHLSIIRNLSKKSNNIHVVTDEIMEYISPAKTSQKILAVMPKINWNADEILSSGDYYIAVYKASEPGNLGTIIRSARAFDCRAVILIGNSVDEYNPRCVRASAGYILSVPIIRINDFDGFFKACDMHALNAVSISIKGTCKIEKVMKNRTIYVFGSEASGLAEYEGKFAKSYRIPMNKEVESLNLGIAASIIMQNIYGNKC